MNSSRTLADRFRTQRTDRIRVDGVEVLSVVELHVPKDCVLEVIVEDSRPDIEQALRVLSRSSDINLVGSDAPAAQSMLILTELTPSFEIEFADLDEESGKLQIWNSWILGDGEHSWIGNSGIVRETLPVPEGATERMRLWCSDGLGDPDFDDLVLLVTVGPKAA